ncbi:MAG: type I-C CRISPR-associated protein Cas7/Csd2 [Anaerolineaceae bacterium]|jgi:CRISPR-associated protein Csd2
MTTLSNKIDFAVIINVKNANPNGDPLNGNRPRVNYDGTGELSDVCIKRKIRNRLMEEGHAVYVQPDDNRVDEYRSLKARADGVLKNVSKKDENEFRNAANKTWIDVRAFGQVFAFKKGKDEDAGVSIGIRGPVSIHPAFSIVPVLDRVTSVQITKSVSNEGDGSKPGRDTMGMKHRVDHGVYVFYGSINTQLAQKTGFSDEDAQAIKNALVTLFRNDASFARPEGSMEVYKVFWWEHPNPTGKYSSAKVHRVIREYVKVKPEITEPNEIGDYQIPTKQEVDKLLPGLECEVLEGE